MLSLVRCFLIVISSRVVFGLKMSFLDRVTVARRVVLCLKMSRHCRAKGHLHVGFHLSCHFRTVGRPSVGGGQSSFVPILGPFVLEGISPASCHCCATGYLPAGGSQLPPGSTISSGQFLRHFATPCSLLLAPMPPLPSIDRFRYGIFLGTSSFAASGFLSTGVGFCSS
jgi:hypothetical protein